MSGYDWGTLVLVLLGAASVAGLGGWTRPGARDLVAGRAGAAGRGRPRRRGPGGRRDRRARPGDAAGRAGRRPGRRRRRAGDRPDLRPGRPAGPATGATTGSTAAGAVLRGGAWIGVAGARRGLRQPRRRPARGGGGRARPQGPRPLPRAARRRATPAPPSGSSSAPSAACCGPPPAPASSACWCEAGRAGFPAGRGPPLVGRDSADKRGFRLTSRTAAYAGPTTASTSGWVNSSAASSRTSSSVTASMRAITSSMLEQLVVDQLGLAEPRHPRAGVLEAEHQSRRAAGPCRAPAPRR